MEENYTVWIDECGCGCGFYNMCACALIIKKDVNLELPFDVKSFDSKKLSEKKRNIIAEIIKNKAIMYSVQTVSAKKIDEINILQSRYLCYRLCIDDIESKGIIISQIIVDGDKFKPYFSKLQDRFIPHSCIIKGDSIHKEIGYASIIAKTYRDEQIYELCENNSKLDEYYGIKSNKGYLTKKHMEGLKIHGTHHEHRKSYKPCINVDNIFNIIENK